MKHQLGRLKKFIKKRQRLMGFIILILFNVLVHIINVHNQDEPGKFYSNVPTPSRFFPENGSVLDFPFGNEDVIASLVAENDVFVMLYAPWSVHCAHARDHFEAASSFFQDKVYFVAINCWHSGGLCRQKRNLIAFPTFYYYKQDFEGFLYNGIPRSDLLVHFVELMMDPVEVLNSGEHLENFLSRHEMSVISLFNFASTYQPLGFEQFYMTALKFIESDAMNVLRFAITTSSSVASLVSLHSVSSVSLIKGSKCVNTYALQPNTSSGDLYQWINIHKGEPSMKWLHLSKMKSLVLSSELKKGPALLLFLPFYPLSMQHQAFFEMRSVSLAYYGCNETEPNWNVLFKQLFNSNKVQAGVLQSSCSKYGLQVPQNQSDVGEPREVCCTFLIDLGSDICVEMNGRHSKSSSLCHILAEPGNFYKRLDGLYSKNDRESNISRCFEVQLSYIFESVITICNSQKKYNDFGRDIRRRSLRVFHEENKFVTGPTFCSTWESYFSGEWTHENHSSKAVSNSFSYPSGFIGSGCYSNHSIRFYMLDFFENDAFIMNLGFPKLSPPMLLYTDVKREILHKFDEHISESSIVHFMTLCHNNDLVSSHLRNEVSQRKASSIVQLTSSNFNKLVFGGEKDTVVLYYSKWCGFCSTFSHLYISLAEQFSYLPNLSFARIDADSNDVAQEYSSPFYPSIVLFSRDNNSIPFPKDSPRSFSSLMKFLKWHLTSGKQTHPLMGPCNKYCIKQNAVRVRKKLQKINTKINLINHILSKNVLEPHDRLCMRRELARTALQAEFAQFLFQILSLPTTGNFLEKHKLSSLLKRQILYRTKLENHPKCR